MKRIAAALMLLLIAASMAFSVAAHAAGSTSVSSAPFLNTGRTYHANFATDHLHNGNTEFWKVSLARGDYFSLNGVGSRQARDYTVRVFPAGTSDANLSRRRAIVQGSLSALIGLDVPLSGVYPVAVTCGGKHPCARIAFSVSLSHQLDLLIPHTAKLKLSGTFTVTVRTLQGKAMTNRHLVINLYGLWKDSFVAVTHHVLGSSDASKGRATFTYHLPAGLVGRTISLQATASGAGYRPTSSGLCQARVV